MVCCIEKYQYVPRRGPRWRCLLGSKREEKDEAIEDHEGKSRFVCIYVYTGTAKV